MGTATYANLTAGTYSVSATYNDGTTTFTYPATNTPISAAQQGTVVRAVDHPDLSAAHRHGVPSLDVLFGDDRPGRIDGLFVGRS